MLSLYSYPNTRGTRITWICKELGLDFEHVCVNLYVGEHRRSPYKDMCPTQRVPMLKDGDLCIAESGAIVTYLADKAGKLIPAVNTPKRAKYEEMMSFLLSELEQPLWTQGKHSFVFPEEKRVPAIIEVAQWEFQRALAVFSVKLENNDYLLGDEFSAIDVIAGQILAWASSFKQPIEFSNVKSYQQRVLSRQAYKDACELEKEVKRSLS